MELAKYNWNSPAQLQSEINRLFGNWGAADSSSATANWVPAADVTEYANRFELFIDLPGVDPDSVELSMVNGVLSISGERIYPESTNEDKQQPHRMERGQGRFHRRFILPDTVDMENVEAISHLGVLRVQIGKQPKAQPKRITVSAA